MNIGIVTAMYEETLPVYKRLLNKNTVKETSIAGMKVFISENQETNIYMINCGVGEIRAAMATQILIDKFNVERILNFGFVGSLSDKYNIHDLVLVDKTVHYQFDLEKINGTPKGQYNNRQNMFFETSEEIVKRIQLKTNIPTAILASGDEFIAESEKKKWLVKTFNADICDMEMAGISLVCENNKIPTISLKVVSDNANEEANQSFEQIVAKGVTKYDQYLETIIKSL